MVVLGLGMAASVAPPRPARRPHHPLPPRVPGHLCHSRQWGALEYFVLELADWVNVVPVTSARELVMVRQYRHATRGVTLEIPAGSVKENEVPADAARRELLEETGYAAGNLIHLGTWECNPALQTNRLHTFLGVDVEKVAEPAAELDERLEVMTVPQAHWLSDRIDSAFSHYFSSYAIELARAHVRADRVSGRI
jgi:ADP-ribose pyrophosphatase